MLVSDLLVVAGHPVPADLLPLKRDARVMQEFAYCASLCDHAQMAALVDFIRLPPSAVLDPSLPAAKPRKVYWRPEASYLATVLDGNSDPRVMPLLDWHDGAGMPASGPGSPPPPAAARRARCAASEQRRLSGMWSLRQDRARGAVSPRP